MLKICCMSCVQNKEMSSLQKKLEALEAALGSPSDTAAGFARRLIKESPAPSMLFKTPKLSTPTDRTQEIDLDTSMDLFATPKPVEPPKKRPRIEEQRKTTDKTFRTLSSAAGKPTLSATLMTVSNEPIGRHAASASHRNSSRNPTGKLHRNSSHNPAGKLHRNSSHNPAGKLSAEVSTSLQNISNKPSMANVGVRSNIPFMVSVNFSQSSTFREGYNGLGGHEKVVVPRTKVLHSVMHKKPVVGGQLKRFFGPSKTSSTPPLPSLDDTNSDIEN